MFGEPPMEAIVAAIREEVPAEPERNIAAAEDAYREVRILGTIPAS
jgi:Pyruvate/2-oxoacid:ferredoxin oxidoreductase gamma subunit